MVQPGAGMSLGFTTRRELRAPTSLGVQLLQQPIGPLTERFVRVLATVRTLQVAEPEPRSAIRTEYRLVEAAQYLHQSLFLVQIVLSYRHELVCSRTRTGTVPGALTPGLVAVPIPAARGNAHSPSASYSTNCKTSIVGLD